jgi:hypothetical protein
MLSNWVKQSSIVKIMPKRFIVHKNCKCVSAGIIFYRIGGEKLEFLIQHKQDKKGRWWYEDLGGKIDPIDDDVFDIASREASEESNAAFINDDSSDAVSKCTSYIKNILQQDSIFLAQHRNKYGLFLAFLPNASAKHNFGTHENNNKFRIKRDIRWMTIDEICDVPYNMIHPRIRYFRKLLKIKTC